MGRRGGGVGSCSEMFAHSLLNVPITYELYPRDESALTSVHDVTLREKVPVKLAISPIHVILKPGLPRFALTLQRQVPGRMVIVEIPGKI